LVITRHFSQSLLILTAIAILVTHYIFSSFLWQDFSSFLFRWHFLFSRCFISHFLFLPISSSFFLSLLQLPLLLLSCHWCCFRFLSTFSDSFNIHYWIFSFSDYTLFSHHILNRLRHISFSLDTILLLHTSSHFIWSRAFRQLVIFLFICSQIASFLSSSFFKAFSYIAVCWRFPPLSLSHSSLRLLTNTRRSSFLFHSPLATDTYILRLLVSRQNSLSPQYQPSSHSHIFQVQLYTQGYCTAILSCHFTDTTDTGNRIYFHRYHQRYL